jgi:DNA polymerase III sliding clamp (beta) subunit (PCNA family)
LHWNNDILETSDNYAITRCTLASTHQGARCILIPRESASVLLKFDPTAFTWTGDWLHFKTKQNAVVSCRTFEGVFPDLSRCLSLEPKKFIEFPPNFLTILKRVSKITPKNDFLQKDAKISIGKGVLTICVRVGDGGQFQESCPVDFKGTLTFNVDLIRLEQILKEHGNHVAGFVEFKGTSGLLKFETDNVVQQVLVSSVSHVS